MYCSFFDMYQFISFWRRIHFVNLHTIGTQITRMPTRTSVEISVNPKPAAII